MLEGVLVTELGSNKEYVVCRVISDYLFDGVSLDGEVKSFRNVEENKKWVFSEE